MRRTNGADSGVYCGFVKAVLAHALALCSLCMTRVSRFVSPTRSSGASRPVRKGVLYEKLSRGNLGFNSLKPPQTDLKSPQIRLDQRHPLEVKLFRFSLSARSVMIAALMLIVVASVVF